MLEAVCQEFFKKGLKNMCAWYDEEEIEEEYTVKGCLEAFEARAREAQREAYLEGYDYDEDNRYDEWRDNFEGGYSI